MAFWNKKIKSVNKVAKELGADKQIIKELKDVEREIKGETMDKVLNAINKVEEKENIDKIDNLNKLRWCNETDLNKKMKEFGYENRVELSKKIKLSEPTLCMIFDGKYDHYTYSVGVVYDFFHNDFNKIILNKNTKQKTRHYEIDDDKAKKIMEFINNTNFKEIRKKYGCKTDRQMAELIGLPNSTYCDNYQMRVRGLTKTKETIYNFFNNNQLNDTKTSEIKDKEEKSINVLDKEESIENEVKNNEIQGELPLDDKVIEEKKEIETENTVKEYLENKKQDSKEVYNIDEFINEDEEELTSEQKEIKDLKRQLTAYVKLIERL